MRFFRKGAEGSDAPVLHPADQIDLILNPPSDPRAQLTKELRIEE